MLNLRAPVAVRSPVELAILRIADHRQNGEENSDHDRETLAPKNLQRLVLHQREKHDANRI